jgi:serine phosphatase RsbU (regulator of sigma subunit)
VLRRGQSMNEVRDATLTDVSEFRGDAPVSDDVTLVLLKRLQGSEGPD